MDPEQYLQYTDPDMLLFAADQELTHTAITSRDTETDYGLTVASKITAKISQSWHHVRKTWTRLKQTLGPMETFSSPTPGQVASSKDECE